MWGVVEVDGLAKGKGRSRWRRRKRRSRVEEQRHRRGAARGDRLRPAALLLSLGPRHAAGPCLVPPFSSFSASTASPFIASQAEERGKRVSCSHSYAFHGLDGSW